MTRDGKLDFADVARFNYELDTNARLKAGIGELNRHFKELSAREYRAWMLGLLHEAGINITAKELEMLLLLRQKTDQILVSDQKDENANERSEES